MQRHYKNATAKITSQHGLIYDTLIHQFGTEKALTETHHLKSIVTLEDHIKIERKGVLYVYFAAFGNGGLYALYDRSNGFYRRQLLLTTKDPAPVGWNEVYFHG